jgi:hypothetical protein
MKITIEKTEYGMNGKNRVQYVIRSHNSFRQLNESDLAELCLVSLTPAEFKIVKGMIEKPNKAILYFKYKQGEYEKSFNDIEICQEKTKCNCLF